MKNIKFSKVYCSDLDRCKDTLNTIRSVSDYKDQDFFKNENITYSDLLREKSGGIMEG